MIVSKFKKNSQDRWTFYVDGRPFLYNSVEAYLENREELPLIFERCKEAGYKILSLWLIWAEIEPVENEFDFSALKEIIELAKKHGIRVELVWCGTNFCDKLDERFAPDWIITNKKFIVHDSSGNLINVNGNDMGECIVANMKSQALLRAEKNALISLTQYLAKYDETHRVVLLRLANDINMNGYSAGKESTLKYINSLARAVWASDYKIAVTVTVSSWYEDDFNKDINDLSHLNAQGISAFIPDLSFTRKVLNSLNATKFKYISGNAAYDNTTSHMVTAFCNAAAYCVYRLNEDVLWDRPGVYSKNYEITPITIKIRDFNKAVNKMAHIIASATQADMVGFNIEGDGMPDMYYREKNQLHNLDVGYITRCNSSVGMGVYNDNSYYFITDSNGSFFFDKSVVCEEGYFDEKLKWVTVSQKQPMFYDSQYYYNCDCGECLRVRYNEFFQ